MKTWAPDKTLLYGLFFVALALHAVFSFQSRGLQARWTNVPPPPREQAAALTGLGDKELSYRLIAIMLQNLGDTGGRSAPLKDYDYDMLVRWFSVAHSLSPHSAHVPYLAAFYFSAVPDKTKIKPLVEYLRAVGHEEEPNSWRWLAQAVYLARYELDDMELAYDIAIELAARQDPGLPAWTRQMPAFILNAEGKKAAAYDILVSMLKSEGEKLPPQEVNAMRDYICKRILDFKEAAANPLCD